MQDTTITEAQERVDAWISQWEDGYWPPLANLARLTEELGELARVVNHLHGPKPPKKGEKSELVLEFGDLFFVLITLANSLGVDLDDALNQSIQKYDQRDAGRFEKVDA